MIKTVALLTLLTSAVSFAEESTIVGAWHMDEWQVIDKNGHQAEFCKGGYGILIYEESGNVSTSINCPPKKEQIPEPADSFDRRFFYAGSYEVKGDVIYKQVANATALGLIGKTVPRKIERITAQELILTGPFGSDGGTLWIRWTRQR